MTRERLQNAIQQADVLRGSADEVDPIVRFVLVRRILLEYAQKEAA